MTEQIVYNVLHNGPDNPGASQLIGVLLVAGFFSYLALFFRKLRGKGISIETSHARTNWLRNIMADHAVTIVIGMTVLAGAYTFLVWHRYRADSALLADGRFQSVSGSVTGYSAVSIWRGRRADLVDTVPGLHASVREQDELAVGGRTFVISCETTAETAAASAGQDGRCLELHRGDQVRIDFVPRSGAGNRAEPLRIKLIR